MGYITQILGTGKGGYLADAGGVPRLLLFDNNEGIGSRAGRWNGSGGGTYQQDFDLYFTTRAAQGYNAWAGSAWATPIIYDDCLTFGRTWDGVYPFCIDGTPGQIASGTLTLNDDFWVRVDYLFSSALSNGMACWLNPLMSYDLGTSAVFDGATSTHFQEFGAAFSARYPLSSYPHVQLMFGDDSNAGTTDSQATDILTGVRSAGDTRSLIMYEYEPETNSHIQFVDGAVFYPGGFGMMNAAINWCYEYHNAYIALEESYKETGTTPIPAIYGDGLWYGLVGSDSADYTLRRTVWWSLASGARGLSVTSGQAGANVWRWDSGAPAALTNDPIGPFCTATIKTITGFFTSLRNWHKLAPDTSSAFITSGRGTRVASPAPADYYPFGYGDGDDYVAGSITADGSLAVIYCGQHFSITVDTSKLAAGYGARWIDPVTCAATSATPGSSYNSAPLGNNSAGNPDWVLVLMQPPYATWTVP